MMEERTFQQGIEIICKRVCNAEYTREQFESRVSQLFDLAFKTGYEAALDEMTGNAERPEILDDNELNVGIAKKFIGRCE